jgi:Cdc6-like AAA superfamily ATPase
MSVNGQQNGDMDDETRSRKLAQIGRVFRPSAPMTIEQLFAGRNSEMASVNEAISAVGQHAVIFGERGVGKTSLAEVSAAFVRPTGVIVTRINCQPGDDFDSLWQKVIDQLVIDFQAREADEVQMGRLARMTEILNAPNQSISSVRVGLRSLSATAQLVLFLDEFDQIGNTECIMLVANLIKALSDYLENVTIIPVGVAESLDALLEGHLSAVRSIVQVRMPRMSSSELEQLVTLGLRELEMAAEPKALRLLSALPKGLPQYAHLLGGESARHALLDGRSNVTLQDVQEGLRVGLGKLDHSLQTAYQSAIYSAAKSIYREVLLACAISSRDAMGDFAPNDVREPLSKILGRQMSYDQFNPHLKTLSEKRDVLARYGESRRWRYRFREPLMEPYVILQGLESGMIQPDDVPAYSNSSEPLPPFGQLHFSLEG